MQETAEYARIVQAMFSAFVIITAWITYRAWKTKQNLDRRNAAIGYSLTKNKEYFEARGRIEAKFASTFAAGEQIDASIIMRMIEDGNEILARDIRLVLAHWEIMAISILDEIIDEKTCFEVVGKTLVTTVYTLRKYIDAIRDQTGKERRYDYLLILNDMWVDRLNQSVKNDTISRYRQFLAVGGDVRKFKRHLHMNQATIDGPPWRRFIDGIRDAL